MEFRLVYSGKLKPNGTVKDKHDIRGVLGPQIRELWNYPPLNYAFGETATQPHHLWCHDPEQIAKRFTVNDWSFVPLVRNNVFLVAQLDILMLRPGPPGSIILQGGDIDNRLKTLFDALRVPKGAQEIPVEAPLPDQVPLYCLLSDDSLITAVSVTTDTLLKPGDDHSRVELVIHVKVHPVKSNSINEGF